MADNNLEKATTYKKSISSVTFRSIAVGLLLLPINIYWMSVAELKYDSQATALPLFIYPVFLLFLLTLANLGLGRLWKKATLQQGELLTIYVMLVISTSLGAYGIMQDLFAVILHPYQFATPENDWEALFFRYIPSWLTLNDHQVISTYYEGDSTLYLGAHLKAWMKPALVWGMFALLLIFVMHCINTLVRKQWVQQERLAFPIIQLPLAMTRSETFFKHRLLWLGFGIVALIDLMNGLHVLMPKVPAINMKTISMPVPPAPRTRGKLRSLSASIRPIRVIRVLSRRSKHTFQTRSQILPFQFGLPFNDFNGFNDFSDFNDKYTISINRRS